MEKYDNTNRGAMFKNDRKKTETHPDLGGTLDVGGVEYFINAWKKTSKAGAPFYSLSVTKKEAKVAEAVAEEVPF
tara:strand:- start:570 stop:794 length:225 start_codon:yes stop_codon:yes gene_type:complete